MDPRTFSGHWKLFMQAPGGSNCLLRYGASGSIGGIEIIHWDMMVSSPTSLCDSRCDERRGPCAESCNTGLYRNGMAKSFTTQRILADAPRCSAHTAKQCHSIQMAGG